MTAEKHIKVSDIGEAVALHVSNAEYAGAEKEGTRVIFVFNDVNNNGQDIISRHRNGTLTAATLEIITSMNIIRNILRSEMRQS